MFIYDYPLSEKYLSKFMRSVIKNDRKAWKSHFCSTHSEQHYKCPDEAFVVLQKYWVNEAGKEEARVMKEKNELGCSKSGSVGSTLLATSIALIQVCKCTIEVTEGVATLLMR